MIKLKSLDELAVNVGTLQASIFLHKERLQSINRLLDSFHDGDLIEEKVYEILKNEISDAIEYFGEYEGIVNESMMEIMGNIVKEVLAYEISNR